MEHPDLPLTQEREVFSVSELNRTARRLIETSFGVIWIEGEISNLARPSSGHIYLSLKDESAQVRCAMFRQANRTLKFSPENGQKILARGRVGLYEARGEFQLILDYAEEAGEGLLQKRFEALKRKLAAEGLFDADRKKPLPGLPRRIGVITSPSGAAVRDIVSTLSRRFPAVPVLIYPTAVQGESAASEIARTLELADQRRDCDLLILARGGGSLEDLWSFNEEIVARALAALTIPVISGVGHEIDFTIADFVADLRAPTPTGAAELAVPDQADWRSAVTALVRRFSRAAIQQLADLNASIAGLAHRLTRSHPGTLLREFSQRLDDLELRLSLSSRRLIARHQATLAELMAELRGATPRHQLARLQERHRWLTGRLHHAVQEITSSRRSRLELATRSLNTVSPLATLDRGYAIVSSAADGSVITDATTAAVGTAIEIRLSRGELNATVEASRPSRKDET